MENSINFDLWCDDENGKRYAMRFIQGLGDARAIKVALILAEDYGSRSFAQLMKDKVLVLVEGRDDLYYLRIDRKGLRIRLFGTIRGRTMHLVHGVKKTPRRPIAPGHFDTAEKRAKRIAK